MKCPYNRKSEKHIQKWGQSINEDNIPTSGVQTDEYTFKLMECEKRIAERGTTENVVTHP